MNTLRQCILVSAAAFALLSPAVQSEQPQRSSHLTQEERIKKLEERADAAEKVATAAAMEKDYIPRNQNFYESSYQRALNTQLWTLGIVGFLLTVWFGFVARFSLNMFEQQSKLATADVAAQLRNEYARIVAKEVQKLWDSNAADTRKLRETLTAQTEKFEQSLNDRSDFQILLVQGLAAAVEERHKDAMVTFRQALSTYKLSKPRNLIETKTGATVVRHIFESLRKKHGQDYAEKTREELTGPLYNDLESELALAALENPWLTPLIKERNPASPESPGPEPAPELHPVAAIPVVLPEEPDLAVGDESDSCRLLNS